jgi:hypothetical protein
LVRADQGAGVSPKRPPRIGAARTIEQREADAGWRELKVLDIVDALDHARFVERVGKV